METELRAVSDLNYMTALELTSLYPLKTEIIGLKRFTGYYSKDKADKVIASYEEGALKAPVIEVIGAMRRVKDRIFAAERAVRNGVR